MSGPILNIGTDPALLPWLSNVSKAAQEAQKQALAADAKLKALNDKAAKAKSENDAEIVAERQKLVAESRQAHAVADELGRQKARVMQSKKEMQGLKKDLHEIDHLAKAQGVRRLLKGEASAQDAVHLLHGRLGKQLTQKAGEGLEKLGIQGAGLAMSKLAGLAGVAVVIGDALVDIAKNYVETKLKDEQALLAMFTSADKLHIDAALSRTLRLEAMQRIVHDRDFKDKVFDFIGYGGAQQAGAELAIQHQQQIANGQNIIEHGDSQAVNELTGSTGNSHQKILEEGAAKLKKSVYDLRPSEKARIVQEAAKIATEKQSEAKAAFIQQQIDKIPKMADGTSQFDLLSPEKQSEVKHQMEEKYEDDKLKGINALQEQRKKADVSLEDVRAGKDGSDRSQHQMDQDNAVLDDQKNVGNFEAHMSGGTGEGRHLLWGDAAKEQAAKEQPAAPASKKKSSAPATKAGEVEEDNPAEDNKRKPQDNSDFLKMVQQSQDADRAKMRDNGATKGHAGY